MNALKIVFWVLLAALLVLITYFLSKVNAKRSENSAKKSIIAQLTKDALFLAIILIMGFVPNMGYITVAPGVSLTLMHIPVLIGCACFGWKRGWLYGLFFGATSCIQALQNPVGFNAFFVYPWISILPRVIFGLVAGLVFDLLKKLPKILQGRLGIGLAGFLMTLLHTGLVFLDLFIFYPSEITAMFHTSSTIGNGLVVGFAVAILVGAAGEALLGGVITAIVGPILKKLGERKN